MGRPTWCPIPTGDQFVNRLFVTASALALATAAATASAQDMQMPGMTMPTPASPAKEKAKPAPVQNHDAQVGAADHGQMTMAGHSAHMATSGALGPYAMNREGSGTSWQPDSSEHMGLHVTSGGWTLMAHVFHAVVAGTVNFDDVQTVAAGNLAAVIAFATWRHGRPFHAIE